MLTGFNTDITYRGRIYHVQTEDKGKDQALIETVVCEKGRVLEARRSSYKEFSNSGYDPQRVAEIMERQHKEMIQAIKTGKYDQPPRRTQARSERSLKVGFDEQILESFSKVAGPNLLSLCFVESPEFTAGRRHIFKVRAEHRKTAAPLSQVAVRVSLVSTFAKPLQVWEGKTGEDGEVKVDCTIPAFTTGHAAIIIRASSEHGHDRLEQLIKKS